LKVNIYEDRSLIENRVDIYCKEESRDIISLVNYINDSDKIQLVVIRDNEVHMLLPNDIFYFESVDKKCFAYLSGEVYQIDSNLIKLEQTLSDIGFVRINKSTIVNIYKIDYVKYELNMRVHAYLENGEILVINRYYKKEFQNCIDKLKDRLLGGNHEDY